MLVSRDSWAFFIIFCIFIDQSMGNKYCAYKLTTETALTSSSIYLASKHHMNTTCMVTESHPVISSVGCSEPGAGPPAVRKSQDLHPKALCNSDGSCSWGWTKFCSKNYILTLFFWWWKHFKSLLMWFEGRKRHDAPLHEIAESSSEVWPFSARVVVTPSRQTGCFMSFFFFSFLLWVSQHSHVSYNPSV